MTIFRLYTGRWKSWRIGTYEIEWIAVSGLDMPDRDSLEPMILPLLRLEGIAAVRIDEIQINGGAETIIKWPKDSTA